MKLPGVTFSLKRALGLTEVKRKIAKGIGIPLTKQGLERKVGKTVVDVIKKTM